jgi:predicted DNA-binding transcriptional regulator YafY
MTKNIRLLSILEQLSKGLTLCIKEVALHFNVTVKSIQNDFKILNEYFGEQLIKKGDCYILLTQDSFTQIFKSNPQTIKRFLHLVSIVDNTFYREFIEEYQTMIQGLNLLTTPLYQIENSPYEYLKQENSNLLEELEWLITHRRYATLFYLLPYKEREVYRHSMPLKILYLGENWYLAVLTTNDIRENSAFKLLRINFIERVKISEIEPKFFHDDNVEKIKAEMFLKNIQSSFSKMETKTYRVVLQVHVSKAHYFQNKKYLKSQKVIKKLDNGDVLVSYEVSNDMEIIPIVQRWIPFVKVIEPLRVKEKIEKNIENFIKGE